ncbi:MAG: hypothetical protein HY815_09875 [Candidatus Riflebacteria bacterium]|nr:hypothetical protein [Candidatus Riflebacteria bacterium]
MPVLPGAILQWMSADFVLAGLVLIVGLRLYYLDHTAEIDALIQESTTPIPGATVVVPRS